MKRICLRSAVTCHGKIHDVPRPHRLGVLIKEAHKKRKEERQQKLRQATRRARVAAASAYANLDIPDFLLRPRRVCLTARTAARAFSLTRARDAAQHFADQAQRQR